MSPTDYRFMSTIGISRILSPQEAADAIRSLRQDRGIKRADRAGQFEGFRALVEDQLPLIGNETADQDSDIGVMKILGFLDSWDPELLDRAFGDHLESRMVSVELFFIRASGFAVPTGGLASIGWNR